MEQRRLFAFFQRRDFWKTTIVLAAVLTLLLGAWQPVFTQGPQPPGEGQLLAGQKPPEPPQPDTEEDDRPPESLPAATPLDGETALLPDAPPPEHPFLLLKKSMYPELQSRAAASPWAEMKQLAANDCNTLSYDPALVDQEKAWRMRDITSACGLIYILDPDHRAQYKSKLLATYPYWDDIASTLRWDLWKFTVPQGSAFFNSLISLDIIHDDLTATELAAAETKHAIIGEWFWDPNRSIRSEQSWYATRGMWALYQGNRARIDSAKADYRKAVFEYLTPDGVYTNSLTYGQHRMSAIRDTKAYFMDVLEFTGEDMNYYNNPRLQGFFEWNFGQALTPFKKLYTFGDTAEDYTPGQNQAASYRAYRFSAEAAGHAAWLNAGLLPEGRLTTYVLHGQPLPASLPPTSRIHPTAGAWFYPENLTNDSLSGALWNPIDPALVSQSVDLYKGADGWSHAHKDVNAVHLAAYGEHVLRNSGYTGANEGAAGSSWTYIHSRAESSNTVMINGVDHRGGDNSSTVPRVGNGIVEGFTSNAIDYASGDSGPALPNGKHVRNFVFVHPQGSLPGYFILFDEVSANAAPATANVILHPNADNLTTVTTGQEYLARIGPYNYSTNGVHLTIFQGTPPASVTIKQGGLASWDYEFAGKYLYSNYSINASSKKNIVTVLFPHDNTHPKAGLSRVTGTNFSGAAVALSPQITDVALESNGAASASYGNITFQATASLYRQENGCTRQYFVRKGRLFRETGAGLQGFEASQEVSLWLQNKAGILVSPGAEVKLYYPGISQVRLDGQPVSVTGSGSGWISFQTPAGNHTLTIQSTQEACQAQTTRLNPIADAEVKSTEPGTNFGAKSPLGVDATPVQIAYLKFDLTGLANTSLQSAKLRLKITDGSLSTQNVRWVDDSSWAENSLTYQQRPAPGAFLASFSNTVPVQWVEIDLTAALQSRLGQVVSLALDTSGGDKLSFFSREAAADRPELALTLGPGGTPPPPPTTPAPTPQPTATPAPGSLPLNPSFEIDANGDGIPDQWTRVNAGADDRRIASNLADGAYIYQVSQTATTSAYRSLTQIINHSGAQGDHWEVRVWVKTGIANPTGNLRVRMAFRTSTGALKNVSQALPRNVSGGYTTITLIAPDNYTRFTLYLESSLINSLAYFDNVSLTKR